jgi:hypothetical protein
MRGITDRVRLTYTGDPSLVGVLARRLAAEGCEVNYTPPMERRGGVGTGLAIVSLVMAVSASPAVWPKVTATVDAFTRQFPGTRVTVENDPPAGGT